MTKYILAGGSDTLSDGYGERLAAEAGKGLASPAILSCFFSSEEASWNEKFADWHGWFERYFGQDIRQELATREAFLGQISTADIVYFHGGQTQLLVDAMTDYPTIAEALVGKVVIGSSAGANYLAKVRYSPTADKFIEGSGMVPVNVIVHYGAEDFNGVRRTAEDWLRIRERFEELVGPDQTVTPLREGTFIVREQ